MLLPNEYINDSVESYFYKNRIPSRIIYWIVLTIIFIILLSLPFVYIDISLSSSGFIRPKSEITTLTSPVSETVESVHFKEGDEIHEGDTLLKFRTATSDYKMHYDELLLGDNANNIHDLEFLSKGRIPPTFASPVRQKEYILHKAKKAEIETYIQQTEIEHKRHKVLYDKNLISRQEYEGYYYAYKNRVDELASLEHNQIAVWQADLNNYKNQYSEYQLDFNQQAKIKSLYIVTSPIDGTLEQFRGVYPGSTFQEGSIIAIISPQAELFAECYVAPNDIGFIYLGMKVNLQVSAFNYNEWGMLHGTVEHISSDYIQDEQSNAFFKVRCQIDTPFLTYKKTGRKGYIKKGMAVNAHFIVTKRSLFDLLYQNIDEWINPTQNNK